MTAQVPQFIEEPEAAILKCTHCGLCLSACPTYFHLGNELDSPRGRIYLIHASGENRLDPSSTIFQKHMQLCLECRACETACPSGVRLSPMMNVVRVNIVKKKKLSRGQTWLRRLLFQTLLPSRRKLHLIFRLLRLYQRSRMQKLVRSAGILRLISRHLQYMDALLPEIPKSPHLALPEVLAQRNDGRGRVSLFVGCIMPELFGPVHEATVRVLKHNRVSVCYPSRQTCCGALHLHDGELKMALELARRNIDAFEYDGADFIVVNAAGCGAMLKEYGYLLRDDPLYAERARAFSERVKDISEFLMNIGIEKDMGTLNLKVTYDDPCHLLHGQGIKADPRSILRSIPGLDLVELPDADRCCGSAGVYNIMQPELANRILDSKIDNIAQTGAQVIATGNPGCLLQIQNGLRARGQPGQVLHPIELLDQAYQAKEREQITTGKRS